MVDGKAKLVSEIYCDGLGACLGHCPQDAITVEQREASEFDEDATKDYLAKKESLSPPQSGFVCPGTMAQNLRDRPKPAGDSGAAAPSQLGQWPVQLKLVVYSPMPHSTSVNVIVSPTRPVNTAVLAVSV